jgi:hypothetical protein
MSSPLPARLQAAIPLVNQTRPGFDPFDPTFRAALLDWGLEQIAREIRPDPVFRPLDYARKLAAEHEWRRVVREQGREQRAVVAGGQTAIAQEMINGIIFEIQETRRLRMLDADMERRIDEFRRTHSFMTDEEIRKAEALARITAQYQVPPPQPEDPFTLTQRYEQRINEIRDNPSLTQEEKHQLTQYWRDALQAALSGLGKQNRG